MANITPTVTKLGPNGMKITWGPFLKTDTCLPVKCSAFTDKSVQFEGSIDGGTARLLGSNDGVNFRVLQDMNDADIAKTVIGIVDSVGPTTNEIKPEVTGGTAPSVTCTVLARRPK